jgi:hypothetical protein
VRQRPKGTGENEARAIGGLLGVTEAAIAIPIHVIDVVVIERGEGERVPLGTGNLSGLLQHPFIGFRLARTRVEHRGASCGRKQLISR